jgi:hypothetical protein
VTNFDPDLFLQWTLVTCLLCVSWEDHDTRGGSWKLEVLILLPVPTLLVHTYTQVHLLYQLSKLARLTCPWMSFYNHLKKLVWSTLIGRICSYLNFHEYFARSIPDRSDKTTPFPSLRSSPTHAHRCIGYRNNPQSLPKSTKLMYLSDEHMTTGITLASPPWPSTSLRSSRTHPHSPIGYQPPVSDEIGETNVSTCTWQVG